MIKPGLWFVWCCVLSLPGQGLASEGKEATDFADVNRVFRGAYVAAVAAQDLQLYPLIIVDFEALTLHSRDPFTGVVQVQKEGLDLLFYRQMKNLAHLPLTLFSIAAAGESAESLMLMKKFSEEVNAIDLEPFQHIWDSATWEDQVALVSATKRVLCDANKRVDRGTLNAYLAQVRPIIDRNIARAVQTQVDEILRVLRLWQGQLTKEDLQSVKAIVLGGLQPRKGNVARQVLHGFLNVGCDRERILYAEHISTYENAEKLLRAVIFDRDIARTFFDDPLVMERDLLASAATQYLESLGYHIPKFLSNHP